MKEYIVATCWLCGETETTHWLNDSDMYECKKCLEKEEE